MKYMLIILFLGLLTGCDQQSPVKKIVWTESTYENKELLSERVFRVEYFNKLGDLVFDSTIFEDNLGFSIRKYNNNKLTVSRSQYSYGGFQIDEYSYNSIGQIINTKTHNEDTAYTLNFEIKNNPFKMPVITSVRDRNRDLVLRIEHLYMDSLLTSEISIRPNIVSEDTVNRIDYYYSPKGELISKSSKNYVNNRMDSTVYTYNASGLVVSEAVFIKAYLTPFSLLWEETRLYENKRLLEVRRKESPSGLVKVQKAVIEYWE